MKRKEIDRLIRMILTVDPMQQGYDIIWQQIDIVEEWLERNKSTTQPTQSAEEFCKKWYPLLKRDTYTLEAMQSYANQQKELSDEEIHIIYQKANNKPLHLFVKWMRDKLTK